MRIGVIGLGYVGLTTALGFTQLGHTVVGYEIDQKKLKQIQKAQMPFYEEGLSEILEQVIDKQFFPTDDISQLVAGTKATILPDLSTLNSTLSWFKRFLKCSMIFSSFLEGLGTWVIS